MKIDHYISELLYDHDCVIVTDLGGFIANYKPASINPAIHVINPPSKKLAFNSSLKNNDGLLASHITRRSDLSYADACEVIREYVKDALKNMKSGQKLKIEKVGVLYLDNEDHLQFIPDQSVNYLIGSFGLATIHSPQIKRDQPILREETPVRVKPGKVAKKKIVRAEKSRTWKIIEVIPAAAVLTFLFILPPVLNEFNNNLSTLLPFSRMNEYINEWKGVETTPKTIHIEYKSPFEIPPANNPYYKHSSESLNVTPQVPSQTETINETVIDTHEETQIKTLPSAETIHQPEAVVDKTSVASVESDVSVESGNFYVIGGCFRSKENADNFVEEMKVKGADAVIIGQNNAGLYMVSLYSSNSYAQINDALPEIKNNTVKGAWVFKK